MDSALNCAAACPNGAAADGLAVRFSAPKTGLPAAGPAF